MDQHRLQNTTEKNEIKKRAVGNICKYFYPATYTMIIVQLLLWLVLITTQILSGISSNISTLSLQYKEHTYSWFVYIIANASLIILIFLMDIIIHFYILKANIKGLFAMSRYYYSSEYKNRYGTIDDRQYEQMIEASRYTVLFGCYMIFVLIMTTIITIIILVWNFNDNFHDKFSTFYVNIIIWIYLIARDILSVIVIFLSFQFSHKWYEKKYLCGYCDENMKQYLVNKANETEFDRKDDGNGNNCSCCCCQRSLTIKKEYNIKDEKLVSLLQSTQNEKHNIKYSKDKAILFTDKSGDNDL